MYFPDMTVVVISSSVYPSLFMYLAVSDMMVYKRHKIILLRTIPSRKSQIRNKYLYYLCRIRKMYVGSIEEFLNVSIREYPERFLKKGSI